MCKAVREWKKMLIDEGFKKGYKIGYREGYREGYKEGYKIGCMEEGEGIVILNMLRRNISPSQIHQMTGISLRRIKTIVEANLVMA